MEREIKYTVNVLEDADASLDCNIFIPHIRSKQINQEEYGKIIDGLKSLDGFWSMFGYKYMAVLYTDNKEMCNFAENKSTFMINEVLALLTTNSESELYSTQDKEKRNEIRTQILQGIAVFNEMSISTDTKKKYREAVLEYLDAYMTQKELIHIQELPVLHKVNDKVLVYPMTRDGQYTIGIVNPWPGDKSAEAEVLSRMKVGAEEVGLGYVMLDNFGHILEEDTQKATDKYVDPQTLQFIITTHYDTEKTIDSFYYHTLWNPPEIPLNLPDYDIRVSNNYLMNDDYLIYDFGGMKNHLRTILDNKPRTIEGASSLTASFPKCRMLEPKLENPKLFYCGMNWEKVVSNSNRHEGLFKLLDETGKVKFFGPDKVEAWGGLRPWEGYKCYQYSIPFDGFSILNEINDCGICLVLSSDIHRRAGAATNRTYEACAAGAVIISDDNEFMLHYFKDAALFIEYNKENPKDTFEQIMEKYQWIVTHKDEALKLAKRAQEVFCQMFSVDEQLGQIVNNHFNRFKTIEKDLFAYDEKGKVLVSYVVNTLDIDTAIENCEKVINNLLRQYYSNICLGIACDSRIERELTKYVEKQYDNVVIIGLSLYDHKGVKQYTDGQAIGILQKSIGHNYWINILSHEIWFYDHLTTLVRTIQEEDVCAAYSGRLCEDAQGYRRKDYFDNMHISTVFGMNWPDWLPVPGQILFRANAESYVKDYVLECLDGYEHYAYLGIVWIRNAKKIGFSKRMTSCWQTVNMDCRSNVLKAEYQIVMIRDQLKYYIPDGGLNKHVDCRKDMKDYLLEMPIRKWIPAKWYYVMRNVPKKAKKREKRDKKFWDIYNQY